MVVFIGFFLPTFNHGLTQNQVFSSESQGNSWGILLKGDKDTDKTELIYTPGDDVIEKMFDSNLNYSKSNDKFSHFNPELR